MDIFKLTAFDILLMLLWVGVVALGVRTGVLRQLLVMASLYVALIFAYIGRATGGWLLSWVLPQAGPEVLEPLAYDILVVASAIGIFLLTKAVYRETRLPALAVLDSVGGGVIGAFNGTIGLVAVLAMVHLVSGFSWPWFDGLRAALAATLDQSALEPSIVGGFPLIYTLMRPWIPPGPPGFPGAL